MNVYGRLPFGQLHGGNPLIKDVARRMERSPGSLAMKLCNLASFDPELGARGVVGLRGASRLDREVWDAFEANWERMGLESEERFTTLMDVSPASTVVREDSGEIFAWNEGPTTVDRTVRQRIGQEFFRRVVLISYGGRCCMTGIPISALLSASHIVPWAEDAKERLNPRNGLCLAKTQDAAFDRHLITLDEDLRVVLSRSIRDCFTSESVRVNFAPYEGKRIEHPHRFVPDRRLLERHRSRFVG